MMALVKCVSRSHQAASRHSVAPSPRLCPSGTSLLGNAWPLGERRAKLFVHTVHTVHTVQSSLPASQCIAMHGTPGATLAPPQIKRQTGSRLAASHTQHTPFLHCGAGRRRLLEWLAKGCGRRWRQRATTPGRWTAATIPRTLRLCARSLRSDL